MKIFDFRCLMDLHVLGWPEHDLTIFRKCLSVCLWVCVYPFVCGRSISRTNEPNFIKLDIELHLNKNWRWLGFGAYRYIGGAAVQWFLRFLGWLYLENYPAEFFRTSYPITPWYGMLLIRFWRISLHRGRCYSVIFAAFGFAISRELSGKILPNFISYYTLVWNVAD